MDVLFMAHAWAPQHCAGAEMMAHTLARALVERGHRVDVLLSYPLPWLQAPYDYQGVRVYPAREPKSDPFEWFTGARRRAAVVISHLENVPRAVTLGRMYGVPAVHLLHNDHGPTRAWCTSDVSLVVSNTRWIADQVDHPNMIVVPPPVIAADYATTPGDAVTLINVNPDKGAATFYGLAERFPGQKFLAVEGSYGEQIIRDLPNVEWIGHVPGHEMRERVYARTKVLLMPSVYESYGRTAVEAMVSGIPVIAHPTPGLSEALADAGIYAHRDDLDTWQAALAGVLRPEAWQTASDKAAKRAAELDPAADLDRWCAAVEALASRPAP